jgi:uncharacterized protein YkwD
MKIPSLFYPIAIAAFILVSCSKSDVSNETTGTVKTSSAVPATVDKTLLLQLVNQTRQQGCQCGDTYYYPATTVVWNDLLEKAAYNHSSDMYQNNYFSHTGLDGSNPGDRITALGYKWMAYGENIAMGFSTEKAVFDAWLKSPDHCKNIMSHNFKEMGVARTGNYWSQEFGSK